MKRAVLFLALLSFTPLPAQDFALEQVEGLFPSAGFEGDIEFWRQMFTRYGEKQVVFHDRRDLRLIYQVVHFDQGIAFDPEEAERQSDILKDHKKRLEMHLDGLAQGLAEDQYTEEQAGIVRRLHKLGYQPDAGVYRSLPERVLVRFSEPVEQASAENPANYAIDNGIVVTTATLQDDPATVVLSTTAHAAGLTYTLTVHGVRDRAGAPNTIAADSRVGYVFQPQLVISNLVVLSGKAYRDLEGLADGATAYIDRAFTYSGVPAQLAGATYIQTANDDKQSQGDGFLEFDVNQAVTVYVAHDDRYATKPAWLAGYADSGDDLTIDVVFSLLQRDFAAGRISLGGNVNPAEPEGNSMYTVIVVPAENPIPDLPPDAPRRLRIKTD